MNTNELDAAKRGQDAIARRARTVLALLIATIVAAVVLVVFFDPDVQTLDADELAARSGDARAFFAADYCFILLYAVLSPLAIWRFGAALGAGSPPAWIKLALFLVAAGLVDAAENTLLLAATDSPSENTVDAAHALAIPKIALFAIGALLALAVNARAVRTLRRRSS